MKLVIGDVSYPLAESVQGAGIGDLRALKKMTRGLLDEDENGGVAFTGVTPKTFAALFEAVGEVAPADLASDSSFLLHIQSLVWLARRKAGDPVAFDDCNVPLDGFGFEDDETEADVPKDGPAEVAGV